MTRPDGRPHPPDPHTDQSPADHRFRTSPRREKTPMKNARPALVGGSAAALALLLAACGGGGAGDQPADGREVAQAADVAECSPDGMTINVAYNSLAENSMPVAVEAMESRYPGLSIEGTPAASTAYEELTQQIVADIAVGNRPDVIMTGLGQMQFWVDTYDPVPFDTDSLPETYQTQFLGAGTVKDGTTYVAPAQISAPVMAVNQTLLDEAGAGQAEDITTYDELLEVAQQVTDHTGEPSVSIAPSGLPEWFTQGLLQNSGATLANEDGTAAFGDEDGIAALDIWSQLGQRGLEAGIADSTQAVDQFNTGTLPFAMITTSTIVAIEQGLGDEFEWMPIKLPSVDGTTDRALPAGGNGYMVLSDDPCRAAYSQELIGELFTPESVLKASGTQRSYIPVDTEARDELLASDAATPPMEFAWTFDNELSQWGEGFPGGPANQIYDTIEVMAQRLQSGEPTEDVVPETVVQIDRIVEGNR